MDDSAGPAPAQTSAPSRERGDSLAAPLREPLFRRIWLASVLSNLGLMVQGVGAAWAMTQLTTNPQLVALVQTAQMLPYMLLALAAGAVADMYDRRKVSLMALSVSLAAAVILTLLTGVGVINPPMLLIFCFIIGAGMAMFGPAWAASVNEQVKIEALPAAIALNSISFNIARSFGPAIGGLVVAVAGSTAAFGANALFYLPLIYVLYRWKRVQPPSRLPPERLGRAIVSGARYVWHAHGIRRVLLRTLLVSFAGGVIAALMPLVAREFLHGDAQTYGLLLGSFGIGAVGAALLTARIRALMPAELAVRCFSVAVAVAIAVVAISRNPIVTGVALVIIGGMWMLIFTFFNIGVQFSAPRWVAGRALASFQAAASGGAALGGWLWGMSANHWGLQTTLLIAAGLNLVLVIAGIWLKMPPVGGRNEAALSSPSDPEVRLAITGRSGPIIIDFEYYVALDQARAFYQTMLQVQMIRQRNGGYAWSLSRDVENPEIWVESFSCPTWHDYLRQRSRTTQQEQTTHELARAFHGGDGPIKIRRRLERPVGSVRWKDDAPEILGGGEFPQPDGR